MVESWRGAWESQAQALLGNDRRTIATACVGGETAQATKRGERIPDKRNRHVKTPRAGVKVFRKRLEQ